MKALNLNLLLVSALMLGIPQCRPQQARALPPEKAAQVTDAEIDRLIDQLAYSEEKAAEGPITRPMQLPGGPPPDKEKMRKIKVCEDAFDSLMRLKERAFPRLVAHLKDKRQSIPFRNHMTGYAVGNACYWNIYFQLQDRPGNYSEYGLSRKGRDGRFHDKPYWEGTPFEEAGGLEKWLEISKGLSYPQKQIKCLNWLLEREKRIGACDADSYFLNILPLEIQILRRRIDAGEPVSEQLDQAERQLSYRDATKIPAELLP